MGKKRWRRGKTNGKQYEAVVSLAVHRPSQALFTSRLYIKLPTN